MPYQRGEVPRLNDRVQHIRGQIGTVYSIAPGTASVPGDEVIGVKFTDGSSVSASRANEYALISRG